MADAPLHYDLVAPSDGTDPEDETRTVLFLHGIFGSGRNWGSIARRVVRERSSWRAVLVDLREHGGSQGLEPPHTIEAAARDVLDLRGKGIAADAVVGHSFGGKVALETARLAGSGEGPVPDSVWVVDSTPEAGEPGGAAWEMLGHLRGHPGPFATREAGRRALEEEGVDGPVAAWMALNLEEGVDGAWRWRIDPDAMEELLLDFFDRDLREVVEDPPGQMHLHLIRATGSSVLAGEALERARASAESHPRVHLHEVEGGHWLNADNPDALVDLLVGHLAGPGG